MGGHSAWRKRVKNGELAKQAGGAICRHRPRLGRKGKDIEKNKKGNILGGPNKKKKSRTQHKYVSRQDNHILSTFDNGEECDEDEKSYCDKIFNSSHMNVGNTSRGMIITFIITIIISLMYTYHTFYAKKK